MVNVFFTVGSKKDLTALFRVALRHFRHSRTYPPPQITTSQLHPLNDSDSSLELTGSFGNNTDELKAVALQQVPAPAPSATVALDGRGNAARGAASAGGGRGSAGGGGGRGRGGGGLGSKPASPAAAGGARGGRGEAAAAEDDDR